MSVIFLNITRATAIFIAAFKKPQNSLKLIHSKGLTQKIQLIVITKDTGMYSSLF